MTLTHLDEKGRPRMVDVGSKAVTRREAVASGFVRMSAEVLAAIRERRTPKGDPLEVARVAGLMGAKSTSNLIPLCHPLALDHIHIEFDIRDDGIAITASASASARTGVEMEAITAVSVAALTIYDMCKAVDRAIVITDICLESKRGGKSGEYVRGGEPEPK